MNTIASSPDPVPFDDRLALSLLLAAALHALVIFGVTFTAGDEPPPDRSLPTLDIALLPRIDTPPPEEADYLAEANRDGTGNVAEKVPPREARQERVANAPPPDAGRPPLLTRVAPEPGRDRSARGPVTTPAERPSAAELINRSMELIQLDEQLRQSLQAYAERPRQKYISARTREYRYASYMNDWVAKVERVGNLNYPDAARRRGLSGKLLLDVALNADGTIHEITLMRGSGEPVLNDAALRIVELAAPFAPFPEGIRDETDILHITRTWEFLSGDGLRSE